MKRISLVGMLLAFALIAPVAHAQQYTVPTLDPCAYSSKSSAAINISTATTTQIVAATTSPVSLKIYVCGYWVSLGASATIQFEYGTQTSTACDTGATALTGVITGSSTAPTNISTVANMMTQLVVPAGKQLCAVTTTTAGQTGYLTYVAAQ